jgi:hypothetical protein
MIAEKKGKIAPIISAQRKKHNFFFAYTPTYDRHSMINYQLMMPKYAIMLSTTINL